MNTKNKKKFGVLLRALLAGLLFGAPVQMTHAASGIASGGSATANYEVQPRLVSPDGNGARFADEAPWDVFIASATDSAVQVVDHKGNALTDLVVKKFCVSAGAATTEFSMIFDSSSTTTTSLDANLGVRALAPPVNRATATERCVDLNVRAHRGVTMLNSIATGAAWVYFKKNGSAK